MREENETSFEVSWVEAGAGPGRLESELAVRGLPAPLAAVPFFVFQHQVDGGRGNGFFYEAAADAGAIGTVPVSLDDHRPPAAGACPWERGLHLLALLAVAVCRNASDVCDCDSKHRLKSGKYPCQSPSPFNCDYSLYGCHSRYKYH